MQILLLIIVFLFITFVLIQQKEAGLGSMAGGDAGDEIQKTRRGTDQILHNITILLAILFLSLSIFMIIQGQF